MSNRKVYYRPVRDFSTTIHDNPEDDDSILDLDASDEEDPKKEESKKHTPEEIMAMSEEDRQKLASELWAEHDKVNVETVAKINESQAPKSTADYIKKHKPDYVPNHAPNAKKKKDEPEESKDKREKLIAKLQFANQAFPDIMKGYNWKTSMSTKELDEVTEAVAIAIKNKHSTNGTKMVIHSVAAIVEYLAPMVRMDLRGYSYMVQKDPEIQDLINEAAFTYGAFTSWPVEIRLTLALGRAAMSLNNEHAAIKERQRLENPTQQNKPEQTTTQSQQSFQEKIATLPVSTSTTESAQAPPAGNQVPPQLQAFMDKFGDL